MPDSSAAAKASEYLDSLMSDGDSAGGIAECVIKGVPAGIGEPVFDKLDAVLSMAVLSIGAVKGIEFGAGFNAAGLKDLKIMTSLPRTVMDIYRSFPTIPAVF